MAAADRDRFGRDRVNPDWVVLAEVVRPQGHRGEVLADLLTDFPESLATRKRLFLAPPGAFREQIREAALVAHWLHKGRVVLKFAGVDSISDAEQLRGFSVLIPRDERMPLEEDAFYVSDLLGAHVFDLRGGCAEDVGEITDLLPEGVGPAILVVRGQSSAEVLIPFVKAYLKKIDLPAGRVEMELPDGLLSIDAPLTSEERQRMRSAAQGKTE